MLPCEEGQEAVELLEEHLISKVQVWSAKEGEISQDLKRLFVDRFPPEGDPRGPWREAKAQATVKPDGGCNLRGCAQAKVSVLSSSEKIIIKETHS